MSTLNIILLSILQGLTEFLPISSSGHLILFSKFTAFPDQGPALDVAMHVGSMIAIMIYFSEDIWKMLRDCLKTYFIPNLKSYGCRLFWLIAIGTIPAVIFGLALKFYGEEHFRNAKLIGWTILSFGILLFIADKVGMTMRKAEHLTVLDAFLIGCAQALALVPGTSRSGVTMTMGRFLGMERREAAKFSMLLSIPTIIAAGLLFGYEAYKNDDFMTFFYGIDAVLYTFLASISTIYIMMWWLKKSTFTPFVIYRVILGSYLLLDAYGYLP